VHVHRPAVDAVDQPARDEIPVRRPDQRIGAEIGDGLHGVTVEQHRLKDRQPELRGPALDRRRLDPPAIARTVRLGDDADQIDVVAGCERGERIEGRHRERGRAEEDDPRLQREVAFSISARVWPDVEIGGSPGSSGSTGNRSLRVRSRSTYRIPFV